MIETDNDLRGKVAVVTGAGRGLGRAIALGLADAGIKVVLASRSEAQLHAVTQESETLRANSLVVATDISDPRSVSDLAARTVEAFGKVDVLVNNSGIIATRPLLEQTPEEWDSIFATNVRGTFLVTQAIGKHMVQQKRGKVINIASNYGLKGIADHTAYCGSKAAVIAMTKSLALEWARHNIQVNAIAPGYFETDLTSGVRENEAVLNAIMKSVPARRMGRPMELVPWVRLLSGAASDFMTGETIVVDGGQTAR